MTADMHDSKKLNKIVTDLFIRGRKLNISLVFSTEFYFKVPRDVRLNTTHFFIMNIPKKRELKQITYNHLLNIDSKDFMNLHKKCFLKPFYCLVIGSTLVSDNLLRFKKNLLETI